MTTWLLAESTAAFRAGLLTSAWLIPLLLLAVFIKCITLLWRPHASCLCVLSLALMMLGWLIPAASGPLMRESRSSGAWLVPLIGIFALLLWVAAIVLAIVGLSTYDRERHRQGRAQAVWTLSIGLVLAIGVEISMSMNFRKGELSSMVNQLDSSSPAKAGKVEETRVEEFNLGMTRSDGWIVSNAKNFNPNACLMFRSIRPEGYAMVLAEHAEGKINLDQYAEVVKEGITATASAIEEDVTKSVTLNGISFLRRTFVARLKVAGNQRIYYDHWISCRPGLAWQILCWCPAREKERLTPDFDRMVKSFRILDSNRVIAVGDAMKNVVRPQWSYRTRLEPEDWRKWDDPQSKLVDFAVSRPLEALWVMPLELDHELADNEALAAGLMKRLNLTYSDEERWTTQPWETSWGKGLEITGEQTVDKAAVRYILRVVRRGRVAHMHAGWATSSNGNLAVVRAALNRIELTNAPAEPPSASGAARNERSLVFNDIGIALYRKKNYAEAAKWFTSGFGLSKKNVNMLGNAADAMRLAGLVKEGLALLAAELPALAAKPDLHRHHALLLADSGDLVAANQAFLKAIELGLDNGDEVVEWLHQLNRLEAYELAVAVGEAWENKTPGLDSRRWHAQTLSQAGKSAAAIERSESLIKDFPDDKRVVINLGEVLNDARDHARAAETVEKLLADGRENLRALMVLGWSQMGRKWYRDAKATFERAAKLQPDDTSIQAAIRSAAAQLGQGMDVEIKTPVEAVAMPADLARALADHRSTMDVAGDRPQSYLLTSIGYHFERGKPLRRTLHYRIRLNTAKGVNNFSSIDHGFDPLSERVFINRLEVIDPDGKPLATKPEDAYVMDAQENGASHRKQLHFQVPGLRPGCIIDYTVSFENLAKSENFAFDRHLFSECVAKVVFITGEVESISAVGTGMPEVQTLKEPGMLAWLGFELPIYEAEPSGASPEDSVGYLTLGGDEGTWEKVGGQYLKEIASRLEPEPAVTELAAKLVKGVVGEREQIAILARYVQQSVSYTAIEFGVRARMPNAASVTLKKQYGDCKDQALLLHQLLRAAGHKSYLTLVNTQWRARDSQPTLDQFNHMVVQVPALGANRLLDPTNQHLDLAAWQADNLWHSHALVLQPGRVRLVAPQPFADLAGMKVECKRLLRPAQDGWNVTETLTLHGYYAAWMRGAFAGLDAASILRRAQNILGKDSSLQLNEFTFETLDDPSHPARLSMEYHLSEALHVEDGQLRATLPALWERDYLSTTFVKDRKTRLVARYPLQLRSEVLIEGVPESVKASLVALNRTGGKRFTGWSLSAALRKEGGVAMSFDFEAKAGDHAATDYAAWHEEWSIAKKAWDKPLIWRQP